MLSLARIRGDRRPFRAVSPLPLTALVLAGAAFLFGGASPTAAEEAEQGVVPVKQSKIAPVALPAGAFRYIGKAEIDKFAEALGNLAKAGKARIGEVEVLVWQGKGAAMKEMPGLLKQAGYGYTAQPAVKMDGGQITPFVSQRTDKKGDLLGLWVEQGGGMLLLAWTVALGPGAEAPAVPAKPTPGAANSGAGGPPIVVEVDGSTQVVNVMKGAMPKMPTFPALSPKPGVARGYVYDLQGRPLKGAVIGLRSTATGGFYSGASAKTDEKGYYEVAPPWGAAHYYCAGYPVDYGAGRAALGLHPADGEADSFATANGAVENWVLLPYGIADRDGVQEDPRYLNNYFGGNIILSWYVDDDPRFAAATALPPNSTIEITLTPEGPLVDGSPGRPIVIRRTVVPSLLSQLYVNNVPAGAYRITARLADGGQLRMKEVGPNGGKPFGIDPKNAVGSATLLLRPSSPKAEMAVAARGNWDQISIALERP